MFCSSNRWLMQILAVIADCEMLLADIQYFAFFSAFKANLNFVGTGTVTRVWFVGISRRDTSFITFAGAASDSLWVPVSVSQAALTLTKDFATNPKSVRDLGEPTVWGWSQQYFRPATATRINIYLCGFELAWVLDFALFLFSFVGRLLLALLMMQGAIMTHAYQTRSHNTQMLSASDSTHHSSSPSSWPPWSRLLSFLGAVALPQNARNGVKHD